MIRDVRALGVHHFAFLRATLLGVDISVAFERYLAFGEAKSDRRHIESRRRDLMTQLVEAGQRLDATLAQDAKITRYVELLRPKRSAAKVATLPSLDEWIAAEGVDPDMWSEAELLEEYKAAHELDSAVGLESEVRRPVDHMTRHVQALNHLSGLLTVEPHADDPVDAWFARPVVMHLRRAGVETLADLFRLVNAEGYRWHRRVPKIGERQAARIVAWLGSQARALGLPLRDDLGEPGSLRSLRASLSAGPEVATPRFGIVPLERLQLPVALSGKDGVFRNSSPNSLEADDDLQAVRHWLARYEAQPATQRSYRKEIERFVLWCAGMRRKPMSSIDAQDLEAYARFLRAVPPNWVNSSPVARSDSRWRPFRSTPSASSCRQAMAILRTAFQDLRDAGYLVANPMGSIVANVALPSSDAAAVRSFDEREWTHLMNCVEEEPAPAARLRLRCLLEFFAASGLRLSEMALARRSDLHRRGSPEQPVWVLVVRNARGGRREVALNGEVIELLERHSKDVLAVGERPEQDRPLIFALDGSVAQWALRGREVVLEQRAEGGGPLSAAGIHAVLKRFFVRVSASAVDVGLDPHRFKAASSQWIRHRSVP